MKKNLFLISLIFFAKICFAQNTIEGTSKPADFIIIDEKVNIKSFVKFYVEDVVNIWQKKGEFEKLADYKLRVTEANRNKLIFENTNEAINILKAEHLKLINKANFKLNNYDTENQSYLVGANNFGDFAIPVPSASAPNFKKNWSNFIIEKPDLILVDDHFIINYLELVLPSTKERFIYDSKNKTSYESIDFKFQFSDVNVSLPNQNNSNSNINTNKTMIIGKSDVDENIPVNETKNTNLFAIIFGNEDYSNSQNGQNAEINVEYARNDAKTFKDYTIKTLGADEKNVFFVTDAGAAKMQQTIDNALKIVSKNGSQSELIFYFAGHGFPDEVTKVPYIIPVDVNATDLTLAIKLSDLYKKLGESGAAKVSVFLDACFSGGGRESGLVSARSIKVTPKSETLKGNVVVFAATSQQQSALPYKEKQHGMFSYYLMKKLQESKGNLTYKELDEYLNKNVPIESLRVNKKDQDPQVNISNDVKDTWENWKLK
ncbi:MAG: caspase family protein [Bacteroidetes bacterium]|nr:caspase family protein [Bacteroidota bacterium]